ncbi:MAG: glycosyltransferase [Eudoraea sp.]|nr:glycosyltransferase [Eudoraea sp.]
MKVIFFCQNAYAYGILEPIKQVLIEEGHSFIWGISRKLLPKFPYKSEPFTTSILDLQLFEADVIFVPGNEVPYYLRGLKVQVFHGLAGEKKGHFRIRHYFDVYLTQGPHFTKRFQELQHKHKDFEVIETGWPKLDVYAHDRLRYKDEKQALLEAHNASKLLLYAPTFSPRLTSAPALLAEILDLARDKEYLILIKFHDLMDPKWIKAYKEAIAGVRNVILKEEKNIVKLLLQADLLISDTSSVIYEFLLLDKPVVSFKTIAEKVLWDNSNQYSSLKIMVEENLEQDKFAEERKYIKDQFHPYDDGKSAKRMVEVAQGLIQEKGVPEKRDLSLARKLKINRLFGHPVENPFTGPKKNKISALLITLNEIMHIEEVIENLSFADEILVVDSYSTDGTAEKIKKYPHVKFIQRPFENFTDQKSYTMDKALNDWILFIDADERIPDPLKDEILKCVNAPHQDMVAYFFRRTFMYKNKILRFSGWQSDKNYRLFRKSKVHFRTDRLVHETLTINGPSGILESKLIHYSYRSYEDYKRKMIKYGQMKAREELNKNYSPNLIHFILRPLYKFINHYFLRLGVLDGKKGIIICYLNALGVYARYKELKRLRKQIAVGSQ